MADESFSRSFRVRWADLDGNAHMRNTAYLDLAADTRMLFFESRGVSMRMLERLRIGPVMLKEELEYFREMRLLENVRVTLLVAGVSADLSRFRLRNEFWNDRDERTARLTSFGGWFDLEKRKISPPPAELAAAMTGLEKTEDYEEIVKPG